MNFGDETIKILNYLGEKFGIAIDWTSDSVLPYLQQLCTKFIEWETSTSIAWIIGAIFAIIAAIIFVLVVNKIEDLKDTFDNWQYGILIVIACIAICVIGKQIYDIITCSTFPEKVIYDFITTQLNNKN